MKKLTTAQIREQERKKLTKEFESKYANYIKSMNEYKNSYDKACKDLRSLKSDYSKLKERNMVLEGELNRYKEWVERLQEFMDLPKDEQSEAFKLYFGKLKESKELAERLTSLMKVFDFE